MTHLGSDLRPVRGIKWDQAVQLQIATNWIPLTFQECREVFGLSFQTYCKNVVVEYGGPVATVNRTPWTANKVQYDSFFFKDSQSTERRHSGLVVSTVSSQQEGS